MSDEILSAQSHDVALAIVATRLAELTQRISENKGYFDGTVKQLNEREDLQYKALNAKITELKIDFQHDVSEMTDDIESLKAFKNQMIGLGIAGSIISGTLSGVIVAVVASAI